MRLERRIDLLVNNAGFGVAPAAAEESSLYAATKHAIEGYSESLDHELRTRGIRVSVIEPAYTKTPVHASRLRLLRSFAPAGLVEAGIQRDLRLAAMPEARKWKRRLAHQLAERRAGDLRESVVLSCASWC
jgi:short-subunit dehydrogenase